MGIAIAFLLGAGCLGLTALGEPPLTIFQNLVYWACFLLICAVHALSRRAEKAEAEAEVFRADIRRLQSDMRGLQGSARVSLVAAVSAAPAPPASLPLPPASTVETAATSKVPDGVWALALPVIFFLLHRFWPEISAWLPAFFRDPPR
ncbi:ABC-type phosphate transport system ATPase subunit [Bradyrhizobium barranii subsp. barranii]